MERGVGTTYHCHLGIAQLLKKKRDIECFFTCSVEEATVYLRRCLEEGKVVLPVGEPCEGFDYLKGCPGHVKDVTFKITGGISGEEKGGN